MYILIIKSLFYSLTLKLNAKNINIFRLKITLKRISEQSSFTEMIEYKARNVKSCLIHQIKIKSENQLNSERFSLSKKFSEIILTIIQ